MWRVCDSRREGVCDGHGAGDYAFNGGRETARGQAHHSWGVPVSPVELGVDSSWVNSCPVVILREELFIHTVL